MPPKKRLGKGLESLIPEDPQAVAAGAAPPRPNEAPIDLSISQLDANPKQPRSDFDGRGLDDLADSIRTHGVLQPILARPAGDRYQIVAGERRFRAAQIAGLSTIPAIIRPVPDDQMLVYALVENLQRRDLNPIERAQAFVRLVRDLKITHDLLSRQVGLSRAAVTNTIRLLELEPDIQTAISDGVLTAGHGRALLALDTPQERLRLARKISKQGLSVRETEAIVNDGHPSPSTSKETRRPPALTDVENQLQEALGTKVRIKKRRKGGQISIHYYDNEDFERLFSLLLSKVML